MSVGIHTSNGFVKVAGVGMGANPMSGATENNDGKAGLVPAPSIEDRNKFLKGNGVWEEVNLNEAVNTANEYTNEKIGEVNTALEGKANTSHGTHVEYATTVPLANGTASAGTASTVARTDHVHPLQTSVTGSSGSCTGNSATATKATQDESGNNIKASYASNMSLSGSTLTLKSKSGETLSTITLPSSGTTTSTTEPTNATEGTVWIE